MGCIVSKNEPEMVRDNELSELQERVVESRGIVFSQFGDDKMNLLHYAAMYDRPAIALYLLQMHSDCTIKDARGRDAFLIAAQNNSLNTLKVLIGYVLDRNDQAYFVDSAHLVDKQTNQSIQTLADLPHSSNMKPNKDAPRSPKSPRSPNPEMLSDSGSSRKSRHTRSSIVASQKISLVLGWDCEKDGATNFLSDEEVVGISEEDSLGVDYDNQKIVQLPDRSKPYEAASEKEGKSPRGGKKRGGGGGPTYVVYKLPKVEQDHPAIGGRVVDIMASGQPAALVVAPTQSINARFLQHQPTSTPSSGGEVPNNDGAPLNRDQTSIFPSESSTATPNTAPHQTPPAPSSRSVCSSTNNSQSGCHAPPPRPTGTAKKYVSSGDERRLLMKAFLRMFLQFVQKPPGSRTKSMGYIAATGRHLEDLVYHALRFPGFFDSPTVDSNSIEQALPKKKNSTADAMPPPPALFDASGTWGGANSMSLLGPRKYVRSFTPMHAAVYCEKLHVVRWLLLLGGRAQLRGLDSEHNTLLHQAIQGAERHGNLRCAFFLCTAAAAETQHQVFLTNDHGLRPGQIEYADQLSPAQIAVVKNSAIQAHLMSKSPTSSLQRGEFLSPLEAGTLPGSTVEPVTPNSKHTSGIDLGCSSHNSSGAVPHRVLSEGEFSERGEEEEAATSQSITTTLGNTTSGNSENPPDLKMPNSSASFFGPTVVSIQGSMRTHQGGGNDSAGIKPLPSVIPGADNSLAGLDDEDDDAVSKEPVKLDMDLECEPLIRRGHKRKRGIGKSTFKLGRLNNSVTPNGSFYGDNGFAGEAEAETMSPTSLALKGMMRFVKPSRVVCDSPWLAAFLQM